MRPAAGEDLKFSTQPQPYLHEVRFMDLKLLTQPHFLSSRFKICISTPVLPAQRYFIVVTMIIQISNCKNCIAIGDH
jgi:hypothetical protein